MRKHKETSDCVKTQLKAILSTNINVKQNNKAEQETK